MAAIKRIIAFAGAAAVLGLAGCSNTHRLNGVYEGHRSVDTKPGTDPIVAYQLALVQLTVRPDGTASLSDQGAPVDGHIDYGSGGATFVPEKFAGVGADAEDPKVVEAFTIALTPNPDGTWTYAGNVKLAKKVAKAVN